MKRDQDMMKSIFGMLVLILALVLVVNVLKADDQKADIVFESVSDVTEGATTMRMYKYKHIRMSVVIKDHKHSWGKTRVIRNIAFFSTKGFTQDDLAIVLKYIDMKVKPGTKGSTPKGEYWDTEEGFSVVYTAGEGVTLTKEDIFK